MTITETTAGRSDTLIAQAANFVERRLTHRHPENWPVEPQGSVRILTHQLVPPEAVFAAIIPTLEALHESARIIRTSRHQFNEDLGVKKAEIIFDEILGLDNLFFTRQWWEVKSANSNSPQETMPLHGPMPLGENPQDSDPLAAVSRVLGETAHVWGTPKSNMAVLDTRKYHYPHGRRKKMIEDWETWVETEIAPFFKEPMSYDLSNRLSGFVDLNPRELNFLIANESLPPVQKFRKYGDVRILDALSSDRRRHEEAHLIPDGREVYFKNLCLQKAMEFEMRTRKEIIGKLLETSMHQNAETLKNEWKAIRKQTDPQKFISSSSAFLTRLEKSYHPGLKKQTENVAVSGDLTSSFARHPQSNDRLWKRLLLLKEISAACRKTFFEHSLDSVSRNAGSQIPYLIGQILMRHGTVGPYEYRELKKRPQARAVMDMIDIAAEVMGIKPQSPQVLPEDDSWTKNPHWVEELMTSLKDYRDRKLIYYFTSPATYPSETFESEYEAEEARFQEAFARKIKGQIGDIDTLSTQANDAEAFLEEPLSRTGDVTILKKMMMDPLRYGTSHIDELILRMWGISPADPREDDQITQNDKNKALKKLLSMRQINQENQEIRFHRNRTTYLFRTMFVNIAGQAQPNATEFVAPNYSQLYCYNLQKDTLGLTAEEWGRINEKIIRIFPRLSPFDLGKYPINVLLGIREKNPKSVYRKSIERPQEYTDFHGKMIVLDKEAFIRQFGEDHPMMRLLNPKQIQTIADLWAREVLVKLFQYQNKVMVNAGYEIFTSKEKETGTLAGGFKETGIPTKQDKKHVGARVKPVNQLDWDWMKGVITLKRTQRSGKRRIFIEEVQGFASINDARTKLIDSYENYNGKRLIMTHDDERMPTAYVLWGIEPEYPLFIESAYQERNILFSRTNLQRKRSILFKGLPTPGVG